MYQEFINEIQNLPKLMPTSSKTVTMKRSDGLSQSVKHEEYSQLNDLRRRIFASKLTLTQKTDLISELAKKQKH